MNATAFAPVEEDVRTVEIGLHPHQLDFFTRTAPKLALVTGVGGGKTWAGTLWSILKGLRNPGVKGLIFANSYKQLKGATLDTLYTHLEELGLHYDVHRQDMILTLERSTPIYLRSMENYDDVRGPEFGWAYGDEVRDLAFDAHNVIVGRLRDRRCDALELRYTTTPAGFNWLYEEFVEKPDEARGFVQRKEDLPLRLRPYLGYEVIHARSTDNPDLPDEYLAALETYDPQLYEQEVGGRFINVGRGRTYYNFDRARNRRLVEYDPDLPLIFTYDFNATAPAPFAVIVAQRVGKEVRAIDEVALPGGTTGEACDILLDRYGPRGHGHTSGVRIYGDATAKKKSTQTGESDYHLIRAKLAHHFRGFRLAVRKKTNPAVVDRVNAVNAKFLNVAGEITAFVSPRCPQLTADLERVTWKPGKREIDKSDAKRTHHSDAWGYLIHQEWPLPLSQLGGASTRATSARAMRAAAAAARGGSMAVTQGARQSYRATDRRTSFGTRRR